MVTEQEITAGECGYAAGLLDNRDAWAADQLRRAARTIRRLEGEVAELSERYLTQGATIHGLIEADKQRADDAELGSLVRRIREHAMNYTAASARGAEWWYNMKADYLRDLAEKCDREAAEKATRRAAEEGEPAPSGWSYRMKDGELQTRYPDNDWRRCNAVGVTDLDVVERVRKGVGNGE